jgi:hypothetical protein
MMYGFPSPYGPSMADSENGNRFGFGLHPFAFRHPMMQTGGGMPPQQMPMQTGGGLPAMQQGMAPNILTGGGLPPQMAMQVGTGGPGQAPQQMPQNRLGGFGGGYNFGLGGLLR